MTTAEATLNNMVMNTHQETSEFSTRRDAIIMYPSRLTGLLGSPQDAPVAIRAFSTQHLPLFLFMAEDQHEILELRRAILLNAIGLSIANMIQDRRQEQQQMPHGSVSTLHHRSANPSIEELVRQHLDLPKLADEIFEKFVENSGIESELRADALETFSTIAAIANGRLRQPFDLSPYAARLEPIIMAGDDTFTDTALRIQAIFTARGIRTSGRSPGNS